MKEFSRIYAIFLPAVVLVGLLVGVTEYSVLSHTGGHFVYPLDDTFIHMAIARNLAFFHVWGIHPYEFASASSSVLYTLVLAGVFRVAGMHIEIPFLVNCVAMVILLYVLCVWLQRQRLSRTAQAGIMLAVIFFTPLPVLVISGMEHTLQCLFTLLFLVGISDWLASREGRLPWSLVVYGMMVCLIRYEGMFLVGLACLALLYQRRVGQAVLLGGLSLLPLVIFGVYSVSKGSYFLPNSVLIKSDGLVLSPKGIAQYIENILVPRLTVVRTEGIPAGTPRPGISLLATQRLLIFLPLEYLLFRKYIKGSAYGYMLLLLTGCTLMQLAFASTGWLYRYEAYLVFCVTVVSGTLICLYGPQLVRESVVGARWIGGLLLFAILFPFFLRSMAAYTKTSVACVNIYEQQYQMGQFLHQYHNEDAAAVNDIGAVSFFTKGKNLDLWGLGNMDVARSRKKGYWSSAFLDSMSRRDSVKVAIVFDSWFSDSLLKRWDKVATWHIQNNVICGGDTVSFYSIEKNASPLLRQQLEEYGKTRLPATVTASYY